MSESGEDRRPERKKRKVVRPSYEDIASASDLEEELGLIAETNFDLTDKINNSKFDLDTVKVVQGKDLTVSYFQRNGFYNPMVCYDRAGLGIRVPPTSFTVEDVRNCVGGKRMLDVMTVADQASMAMSMDEWLEYYESEHRTQLLNVISLEFSLTKLDKMVAPPLFVRKIDWVNYAWPSELKARQSDSTNNMTQMMYPKVQKYCLMSVKGCYTDFHIDFGGTSVWYHIIKGGKVFWLVPPTDNNLKLYEEWTLSGRQGAIFFGDLANDCCRIVLKVGYTFFIPAGWIHAVYTPEDSLVFGGNFLHSFAIERQLKVAQIEDTTKVPQKFRYPFYSEMLWYVLARYVEALLGVQHLDLSGAKAESEEGSKPPPAHIHLTPYELSGIKAIVMYLHALPANRKNIPDLVKDPVALIRDVRSIVEKHRSDKAQLSVSGVFILSMAPSNKSVNVSLTGPEAAVVTSTPILSPEKPTGLKKRGRKPKNRYLCEDYETSPNFTSTTPKKASEAALPRRRRTRCRECMACLRDDCGECCFCADMVKFGGQGKAKQTCKARQCLKPLLPLTAVCIYCRLDGWGNKVTLPAAKPPKDVPSMLMECSACYQIVHPKCIDGQYNSESGVVSSEMPSSWVCPKCVYLGKDHDLKPRHFKARDVFLKLKSEDPSTSHEESVSPLKFELTSPPPSDRKNNRLGHSSPPPELRRAIEFGTPSGLDARELADAECDSKNHRRADKIEPTDLEEGFKVERILLEQTPRKVVSGGIRVESEGKKREKKRPSDEFETPREIAKRVKAADSPDIRRIDSRAESRNENEERLYAAIQKTRECLNYATLKELAMATGRVVKLPIVVVRPPLTEQQIENLDRLEKEEQERRIKAEQESKAMAPKVERRSETIETSESEEEQKEKPARITRLKAEKARESETRVTRRKSAAMSTPSRTGTTNGKSDGSEKRKTRGQVENGKDDNGKTRRGISETSNEDGKSRRVTAKDEDVRNRGRETRGEKVKTTPPTTPDLRRRGRVDVDPSNETDSNPRRGRSAVATVPTPGRIGTRSKPGSGTPETKKTPEKGRIVIEIEKGRIKRSSSKNENRTPEKSGNTELPNGSLSPIVRLRALRSTSSTDLKESERTSEQEKLKDRKKSQDGRKAEKDGQTDGPKDKEGTPSGKVTKEKQALSGRKGTKDENEKAKTSTEVTGDSGKEAKRRRGRPPLKKPTDENLDPPRLKDPSNVAAEANPETVGTISKTKTVDNRETYVVAEVNGSSVHPIKSSTDSEKLLKVTDRVSVSDLNPPVLVKEATKERIPVDLATKQTTEPAFEASTSSKTTEEPVSQGEKPPLSHVGQLPPILLAEPITAGSGDSALEKEPGLVAVKEEPAPEVTNGGSETVDTAFGLANQKLEESGKLEPTCEKVEPRPETVNAANQKMEPGYETTFVSAVGGANEECHNLAKDLDLLTKIFRYLTPPQLAQCCRVCRAWNRAAALPVLNKRITIHSAVATQDMLRYIVRRQPLFLDLSWTELTREQLRWLIVRMPRLKELKLAGSNVSTASALTEYLCPSLEYLDLGFTSGLNDAFLRDILVPKNQVQRPAGATNRKPRLQGLTKLRLAACSITDAGLLILSENLKNLTHIDLSQCWRTTAPGLSQFFESPHLKNLQAISLAGCPHVTEDLIGQILTLEELLCLDIRYIQRISPELVAGFLKLLSASGRTFEIEGGAVLKVPGFLPDW